jgi:hypothetical protein
MLLQLLPASSDVPMVWVFIIKPDINTVIALGIAMIASGNNTRRSIAGVCVLTSTAAGAARVVLT